MPYIGAAKRLASAQNESMLEYADTPEAKGLMTDRVGIRQRSRPVGQK